MGGSQRLLKPKKTTKTLSFEPVVLEKLEKYCANSGTKVSTFVNYLVRKSVMNDVDYYRALARSHCSEMNFYDRLSKEAEERKQTKDLLKGY